MISNRSNGLNGEAYISTDGIKRMIGGWTDFIRNYTEDGWNAYLVSILFHELAGSRQAQKIQMNREIERIYNRLATRMVRKPRLKGWKDWDGWDGQARFLPAGIFVPDWPVPKRRHNAKSTIEDVSINDGLHMGGILLGNKWGRIRHGLERHFTEKKDVYERGKVRSIGVQRITHDLEKAVDYTFKSLKRRTCTPDDVFVLNWAGNALHAEATRRSIIKSGRF